MQSFRRLGLAVAALAGRWSSRRRRPGLAPRSPRRCSTRSSSRPTFAKRSIAELPVERQRARPRASSARRRVEHFEEAIREVPNLNLSGEGSRARYFQLRGVGELEQYDGAPNPSIGFIVDDIDFSGLGSIGTLFDVDRVEVLRGPQGTRYGANALGGLDLHALGGSDRTLSRPTSRRPPAATTRARSAPRSAGRSATTLGYRAFAARVPRATASATTCSWIATTPTAATSSASAAS